MSKIPFRRDVAEMLARLFADAPRTWHSPHERHPLPEQEIRSRLHEQFTWGEIDVAIARLLREHCLTRGSIGVIEKRDGEVLKYDVPAFFHEPKLWKYLEPAVPDLPPAPPLAFANPDEMISAPALAARYDVDGEKLRKRLDYWREQNAMSNDFTEVENRARNEPRFLYRLRAVAHIAEKLKS
jgi:hypothetical protein